MNNIDNIVISTRPTANNAKGKRKISNSRRNIQDLHDVDNLLIDEVKPNKRLKNDIDSNLKGLDSAIPILKSTELNFYGKKVGNIGIRKNLKTIDDININHIDLKQYDNFYQSLPTIDPNYNNYLLLSASYTEKFHLWLWYLQTSNNLYFYGIGKKDEIISNFMNLLSGEDVIHLNGDITLDFTNISICEKHMKKLLELICNDIIFQPDIIKKYVSIESSLDEIIDNINKHYGWINNPETLISNRLLTKSINDNIDIDEDKYDIDLDKNDRPIRRNINKSIVAKYIDPLKIAQTEWGGRYIYNKAKLYILISSFENNLFTSDISQVILSTLAKCSSISLIVTSNHMNISHLLTLESLSYYKFKYIHLPTFIPYELSSDCQLIPKNSSTKIIGMSDINISIESILLSASSKLKSIIGLIAKETLRKKESLDVIANPIDISILESELVEICKKRLIIKTYTDINPYIKELIDQHVISIINDKKRHKYIHMLLSSDNEILKQLSNLS